MPSALRTLHRAATLLLAALVAVLTAGLASPASAAAPDSLQAIPAPGSAVHTNGGWFVLETAAGSTVTDRIELRNGANVAIDVHLDAVDAETAATGGAAYAAAADPKQRSAAWFDLETDRVRLAAGQTRTVGFTVTVPAGARSGLHLAGLAVWSPTLAQRHAVQTGQPFGAELEVLTRNIVAVETRVPGPARGDLTVEGVEPLVRPHGLDLGVHVANRGSDLVDGSATVTLPRLGFVADFRFGNVVPATTMTYPVAWADAPTSGRHLTVVELRDGDGRTLRWEGVLDFDDAVREQLADRGIAVDWARPRLLDVTLLVTVALLLLAGLGFLARRRGSRRPAALALHPGG